jgi:hypothetical protein
MPGEFNALQASHEELVKALKEARGYLANYSRREMWGTDGDDDVKHAQDVIVVALANAAKLAPTRTQPVPKVRRNDCSTSPVRAHHVGRGCRYLCLRLRPVPGEEGCAVIGDDFHSHLDECQRCREDVFNLCPVGIKLLTDAVKTIDDPMMRGLVQWNHIVQREDRNAS